MIRPAHHAAPPALVPAFVCSSLIALAGCGGSGSSSGGGTGDSPGLGIEVDSISVTPGAIWPINQPIEVEFTADVDFATIGPNTIRIRAIGSFDDGSVDDGMGSGAGTPGAAAIGFYELVGTRTVRFVPACPTGSGFAGAGLQPGGIHYTVRVNGTDIGGPTVHSTSGDAVGTSAMVSFSTPNGVDPARVFADPVAGPPAVVVRGLGGVPADATEATYLELGLDEGTRVYFEWDAALQTGALPPGFLVPINHYSRIANRAVWVVQLDQPVAPTAKNLARVELEWCSGPATWSRLPAEVELATNCTDSGARLRIAPRGLLPQGSEVRAVLRQGFSDLVGDALLLDAVSFAPGVTRTSFDPGTTTPGDDADELLEAFLVPGDDPDSLADPGPFDVPRADWSGGAITATLGFDGTGGPGGHFDWFVAPGVHIVLDTTFDLIIGGPNGVPTDILEVVDGIVDLRDLYLPESSSIRIIGPNPCLILASGKVRIEGAIHIDGGDSVSVTMLNSTNLPQIGANGQGGGGSGGTGSFLTTESTPHGGPGFGAFGVPGIGGQGGETGFAPIVKNDRRGAGGGGGRFGPDVYHEWQGTLLRTQTLIGLDAEPGFGGGPGGTGAVSQAERAMGGAIGTSPFVDGIATNDFLGISRSISGHLDEGELPTTWAGQGGGGGGDAVRSDSFPLVPFSTTGDEKGAGGGGGAGGLTILALEEIVITETGRITADGGHGGGGESINGFAFTDRVGGGSGGGSGGHIVLESGAYIEIAGLAEGAEPWYTDNALYSTHYPRPLSAVGGQGGEGNNGRGGADTLSETQWRCDAIPLEYFEGTNAPPSQGTCFTIMPDIDDPLGPVLGAGGDGSPGLIQLHVREPELNLRFTGNAAQLDATMVCAPPPVGWQVGGFVRHMLPRFGPISRAQSKWIALGAARVNPGGPDDQVRIFFGGVDPMTGAVLQRQGVVETTSILGPAQLDSAPNTPYIGDDPHTIVFDARGLAGFDDVYERNPELLRLFTLRLGQVDEPHETRDHAIITATYDPALDRLTIVTGGDPLTDFTPPWPVEAEVIARPFLVETNGIADALSDDIQIRITFDATMANALTEPDESQTFSGRTGTWATDAAQLNLAEWHFVRFRVDFDLDPTGVGASAVLGSALPSLSHMRVPFRF